MDRATANKNGATRRDSRTLANRVAERLHVETLFEKTLPPVGSPALLKGREEAESGRTCTAGRGCTTCTRHRIGRTPSRETTREREGWRLEARAELDSRGSHGEHGKPREGARAEGNAHGSRTEDQDNQHPRGG